MARRDGRAGERNPAFRRSPCIERQVSCQTRRLLGIRKPLLGFCLEKASAERRTIDLAAPGNPYRLLEFSSCLRDSM